MTQNVQMIKSNTQTEPIIMLVSKKHSYMHEIPICQERNLLSRFPAYTGEPKAIGESGTVFTIINYNDHDISNFTDKFSESVFVSSATSDWGVEFMELPYETFYSKLTPLYELCKNPDWDGYGAAPIEQDIFRKTSYLMEYLSPITEYKLGIENICPNPNGTLTVEIESHNNYLEIEIGVSTVVITGEFENGKSRFYWDNFIISHENIASLSSIIKNNIDVP